MIEHINNITNIKIEFLKYIELKYNVIKLSTIYQKQPYFASHHESILSIHVFFYGIKCYIN